MDLRWYAAYKNLLSGLRVISSLTMQSRQKFGKKRDTNFIVYLILRLTCSHGFIISLNILNTLITLNTLVNSDGNLHEHLVFH